MTKGERAIIALREAADALDDIPVRRVSVLGQHIIDTQRLRDEADWIENQIRTWSSLVEPVVVTTAPAE